MLFYAVVGEALLFLLRARNDGAVQGRVDRCQWSQLLVLQSAAAPAATISARAQLTGGPIKLLPVDIHHFDLFRCVCSVALMHLSSHDNTWRSKSVTPLTALCSPHIWKSLVANITSVLYPYLMRVFEMLSISWSVSQTGRPKHDCLPKRYNHDVFQIVEQLCLKRHTLTEFFYVLSFCR
jgi:hypothetical protein